MDVVEKLAPFLAYAPRWLQVFCLVVFFQILLATFLLATYGIRHVRSEQDARSVRARLIASETPRGPDRDLREVPNEPGRTSSGDRPDFRPEPVNDGLRIPHDDTPGMLITATLQRRDELPAANVTIANNTGRTQVIHQFVVDVLKFLPALSIPRTRVLEKAAVIDVALPRGISHDTWQLDDPILLAAGDATTLVFRFRCGDDDKIVSPTAVGLYSLSIQLKTMEGAQARTPVLELSRAE